MGTLVEWLPIAAQSILILALVLEQREKRGWKKSANEAMDLMRTIRAERDHLRQMVVGMAGVRWVAEDKSRIVSFTLSRDNTFYVENGETKH